MKRIYVVWDTVALAVVSSLLAYAADAAAVRSFGDALSDPQSPYSKHPADFELRLLATIVESEEGPVLTPQSAVVITGAQWLQAQPKAGPALVQEAV